MTVSDSGASGGQGVAGSLNGLSFDGTVSDFTSILAKLFSSSSDFVNQTTLQVVGASGMLVTVPGWIGEGRQKHDITNWWT
jgi:hypothetical protein